MKNKIVIIIFSLIIVAATIFLALPSDENSVAGENRSLATMAPLTMETAFSGEFAENFENYLSDNIGFRSAFTGFSEWLNSVKGVESSAGRIVYSGGKEAAPGIITPSTMLIADNVIYEIFNRNDIEDNYVKTLNSYAKRLDKNIKFYSMLFPTRLEFAEPLYANLQDSQKEAIDYIYSKLDSRITTVDAYNALLAHKDEYIYFTTDHHWTALGAYYAYKAFCEEAEISPVSKDSFETYKIKNFLGYLFSFAQNPEIRKHPDTLEWYNTDKNDSISVSMRYIDDDGTVKGYNGSLFDENKKDYGVFLGGDHPLVILDNSENPTGKTLIIIKESFANSFVPWVIKNYKRVIMVDPRSYTEDIKPILDEFEPDDFLVMDYIFAATFGDYCELLDGLY